MGTEPFTVPASLAQQSLWVHSEVTGAGAAYHVTALVRITGDLRLAALRRAWEVLADRHESLRTVFRLDGDELVQVVQPHRPPPPGLREIGRDELDGVVAGLLARPFDLATGPLVRAHVLRLSEREHVAVLVMHHIITDGVSSAVLLADLTRVYEAEHRGAEAELPELPVQYADYAVWHRRRLSGDRLRRLTEHWSARLQGARPLEPARPATGPVTAVAADVRLDDRVHRLAAAHGATPFMALTACFAAVLGRCHDRSDVTVVSPVEGRGRPELAGVVGYFVNAVPIRVDLSGDPTAAELLAHVRTRALEAFDHQELPIEQVAGLLRRHGEPGADRICSGAMIVLQEPRPSAWPVADLTFELLPPPAPVAKADVVLDLRPDGRAFTGTVECHPAARADGAWLAGALATFLDGACAEPDAKISALLPASPPAPRSPAGGPPTPDTLAVTATPAEYVEPRTPLEAAVAGIWQDVLGEGPFGALDNFFDRGGQSLAAVRIATRLAEVFDVEISVAADLYADFTVEAVARRVAARLAQARSAAAPVLQAAPRGPGVQHFPASPLQQGVWDRLSPDRPAPLILGGVRVRGPLDVGRLRRAFADVAARHETLRSTYRAGTGGLEQVVTPGAAPPVEVRDAAPEHYQDVVRAEADRGFDLEHEVPARVVVLRFAADDHAVLLVLHHLVGDRRSVDVLARDAFACYAGRAAALPALPVQFADFARHHHALLAGPRAEELIGYWTDRLRGARPLTLPSDLTAADTPWAPGTSAEFEVPAVTFDAVTRLATDFRITLNSVALTAFATLLARWTGDRDLCVRAPVSFRDDSRVQELVADFSNDVVIRLDLSGDPSFADLLRQAERVTSEAFAHHELPPHLLEPHLEDPGLLSRLFRVQFTTEPEITAEPALGELAVAPLLPRYPYAHRPLSVRLRHGADGPRCVWIYREDLFSPTRIAALAAGFSGVLGELAADPGAGAVPATSAVGGSPD
ncbi:condensation domain-containing protein [Lentzea sp. NPDC060358]|uniref:condensation domain-containing protein n=1 Tax=Lentzea sp. NPDC060358 TaxID=3347103 RepID=UPI00364CB773